MPPGSLFLVRHGHSWLSGTFCGSSNPPLSARGRSDVLHAAYRLSRFSIHLCYASPQRRAQETAAIIHQRTRVPVVTDAALKEIHFGDWEGLRFKEIEKRWPALARRWSQDMMRVRIPHAETFASLRRRIKRFLRSIRKDNVLIIAHGGSLAAIVLECLKLPNADFPKHIQPPGSIRQLRGKTLKWIYRPC